ncbi:hypothetical protein BDZ91DRAFT_732080 [Kalaharituber pfeilii]|nr:hypothetical protein BDZ91DRAFT_732080 [Kalaharituber pfeilii]
MKWPIEKPVAAFQVNINVLLLKKQIDYCRMTISNCPIKRCSTPAITSGIYINTRVLEQNPNNGLMAILGRKS